MAKNSLLHEKKIMPKMEYCRHVLRGYISIIKDVYRGTIMSVRITRGETDEFLVTRFALGVNFKPLLC